MHDYRLYLLNPAGHIRDAIVVEAADDAAAIEACPDDGTPMELWLRDRMVRKFGPDLRRPERSWPG